MCSLVQSRVTTLVFLTADGITVYFDVHQPIEVCHGGTEKRKKLFLRDSVPPWQKDPALKSVRRYMST